MIERKTDGEKKQSKYIWLKIEAFTCLRFDYSFVISYKCINIYEKTETEANEMDE